MEFIKPGANKRVCAYLIDYMIFDLISLAVFGIFLVDFSLLIWILGMVFKDCVGAQSLGRRIVGTIVIDADGDPVSPMETIKRNVIMVLPVLPLVEYVVMLRDGENGQRLGDRWAETRVCDLRPQINDGNFLWASIGLVIAMIMILMSFNQYMLSAHPELMKERMRYHQSVSVPVDGQQERK